MGWTIIIGDSRKSNESYAISITTKNEV